MPMKEYPLSQEEVFRAELMSFRILISVLMSQFLEQHPERDAALKKMQGAVGQIIVQIPLPAIPPERQERFRNLVIDRGRSVIRNANNMARNPNR